MNTNTTAVIGLGALGTLLAYYGYQYLDEEETENVCEDLYNDVSGNTFKESTKVQHDLSDNNVMQHMQDISKNKIKLEVREQINEKQNEELKKSLDKWSNYWEDQYNNIDKEKEITVE